MKRWAAGALALLVMLGCARNRTESTSEQGRAAADAPQPKTPDRLPPGQVLEGEKRIFGFPVPRDMSMVSETRRTAEAAGPVRADDLSEYIRARVLVGHVEIAQKRIVFPQVKLRGDTSERALRIEVVDDGSASRLLVYKLESRPPVEGLSEEARWRKAGITPDGKLIDPHSLE